ncbi:MAG: hypothetical protein R2698_08095 [Microthrixaceae bacterium]
MLRVRHALWLLGEVAYFAKLNRAWWMLLVIPLVAVGLLVVATTHTVLPYTVYTLF